MTEPTPPARACTLSATDYKERETTIRALAARALRSSERDGRRLILTFDAAAGDELRGIVRQERQCCAFLDFDLSDQGDDGIKLTITAPSNAPEALDDTFAQLTPATSCGCAPAQTKRNGTLKTLGWLGGGVLTACVVSCAAAAIATAAGLGSVWAVLGW